MPALDSLKRPDPVTVTVDFGGETVTVTFNQNAMTKRWVKQIQAGLEAEDIETSSRSLVDLIMSWDILDSNGAPVPVTVDVLDDLPLPFLRAIDEAIGDASNLSSAEGNASSKPAPKESSDSTPTGEASPNGSETSTLPESSAVPS